jgi:hypothetical protein
LVSHDKKENIKGVIVSILLSGDFHNDSQGELLFLEKEFLLERYTQKIYSEIKYHFDNVLKHCYQYLYQNLTLIRKNFIIAPEIQCRENCNLQGGFYG